jgi:GNAT superfamily N-acetyltransferase
MRAIVLRMTAARLADAGEVRALSAPMAESFADEPTMSWLLSQRIRRSARRNLLFRLELETYILPHDGFAVTADDGRRGGLVGGCLVLPPDRWRMPAAVNGRTAMRRLLAYGTGLPRAIRMQKVMAAHHADEPHYYVRWVGVRPELRGQGLGTALMQPALDRFDRDGVAAYIEASSERSAALYARRGFVHLGRLDLPEGAPPVWPMRRPPVVPAAAARTTG